MKNFRESSTTDMPDINPGETIRHPRLKRHLQQTRAGKGSVKSLIRKVPCARPR